MRIESLRLSIAHLLPLSSLQQVGWLMKPQHFTNDLPPFYPTDGLVLPHMRILAHTRMGRPICVYSYGTPIRVWDNILSHMSILFVCFISLQVFGYYCYK